MKKLTLKSACSQPPKHVYKVYLSSYFVVNENWKKEIKSRRCIAAPIQQYQILNEGAKWGVENFPVEWWSTEILTYKILKARQEEFPDAGGVVEQNFSAKHQ